MVNSADRRDSGRIVPSQHKDTAIAAIVFSLPAVLSEFGLVYAILPLPAFYCLLLYGRTQGLRITIRALLIAGIAAAIVGSLTNFVFGCTLLPIGFFLADSAHRNNSPALACLKGFTAVSCLWLLFWTAYGVVFQTNPYQDIASGLDKSLDLTYKYYLESSGIAENDLESLLVAFDRTRDIIKRLLPGMLLATIASITWLNAYLGRAIVKRKTAHLARWPEYRNWRLPEHLVWVVIAAVAMLLVPAEPLRSVGANAAVVCGTFYFFQGLSVVSGLLSKWSVPVLFRIVIYLFILVQVFGILLLAFIGLADIWFDFAKLKQKE